MAHSYGSEVFLTEQEAVDHQSALRGSQGPYSETYGLGVQKTTTTLVCGSIVTAWESKFETYSG